MSNIKKSYKEVIEFLHTKKDSKVSDILIDVIKMCESKKKDSTVRRDKDNNIIEVFCYYHKTWEDIKKCKYGSKASSHSGLNTMCKVGVNRWTKQQSDFKKAKNLLLDKVSTGKILPQDIQKSITVLENLKNKIV